MPRALTAEELRILGMIQDYCGPQNSVESLTWFEGDACLFVKDVKGNMGLMANLSNLATWRADGTIPDDATLKRQWLHMGDE